MILLDEPAVVVDLEPEVEPPAPKGVLARAVPVLVVFALLGLIGGAGTFAAFTASTDNAATFATGSLVLENTVTGEDECLSNDGPGGLSTNENVACDFLFDESTKAPGQIASNTLRLRNVGSMDASRLLVHGSGQCGVGEAEDEDYHGEAGDICGALLLTIQELGANMQPLPECIYPEASNSCEFDADHTVRVFEDLDPFVGHGGFSNAILIPGGLGAFEELANGPERFFKISVQLDPDADNNVQGQSGSFSMTWRIEQ